MTLFSELKHAESGPVSGHSEQVSDFSFQQFAHIYVNVSC